MAKSYLEKEKFYWLKVACDGGFLLVSFFLAFYLKRGNLLLEPLFKSFLLSLTVTWLVVTLFSKKFLRIEAENYFQLLKPFAVAAVSLVALVSLFIYVRGWYRLSRLIIYGGIGIYLVLEFLCLFLRAFLWKRRGRIREIPFAVIFFLLELVMVICVFVGVYYYHKGTVRLTDEYLVLLMGIFFGWLLISLLMHQYKIPRDRNFLKVIFPFWRSELVSIGLIAFFIYTANLALFSRFVTLGSLLTISLSENLVVLFYYLNSRARGVAETETGWFKAEAIDYRPLPTDVEKETMQRLEAPYDIAGTGVKSHHLKEMLARVYFHRHEELFRFIEESVRLESIDVTRSAFVFSPKIEQVEMLPDESLHLIVNLQKVNGFRRINRNFIAVNRRLTPGGLFIGCLESIRQRRDRIYRTYPLPLARTVHFFDFILNRVFPKLPLLKKTYFALWRGNNRVISFTESLGRLFFCGFKVVSWREIGDLVYFIVGKEKEPLADTNPSYGPLFKQKRVGKNGKRIYMYKLRTMHPYAEYIQDYVHRHRQLAASGKIRDDFRITTWGRVFRKLLLDEIPMLINWLKRDVKLVGVRPLSESFFETYPEDLKTERVKYKPGLIPPYYADMPGSIEEVWLSERGYLEKYRKRPFATDVVYFFRALNNIFFHHARSS